MNHTRKSQSREKTAEEDRPRLDFICMFSIVVQRRIEERREIVAITDTEKCIETEKK